jgi:hypothetical protein
MLCTITIHNLSIKIINNNKPIIYYISNISSKNNYFPKQEELTERGIVLHFFENLIEES